MKSNSFDERVAELCKSLSFGADIRMPMTTTAILEKAKAEKNDTVDEIDLEKIKAQKDGDKKDEGEEKPDQDKPDADEENDGEKSFRRIDGSSLQKAQLMKIARVPDALLIKVGAWVSTELHKSTDLPTLRKAIASALPEFQKGGKTWVAGLKEPGALVDGDARVLKLNTEVARLQAEMCAEGADLFDQSVLFAKLQDVYEKLAEAVMDSMGLGQQTEDLIPEKKEAPAAMVAKSQAEPITIPENTGAEVVVSL
jgi:hypothetical protein